MWRSMMDPPPGWFVILIIDRGSAADTRVLLHFPGVPSPDVLANVRCFMGELFFGLV
jgi:hypothetical protein